MPTFEKMKKTFKGFKMKKYNFNGNAIISEVIIKNGLLSKFDLDNVRAVVSYDELSEELNENLVKSALYEFEDFCKRTDINENVKEAFIDEVKRVYYNYESNHEDEPFYGAKMVQELYDDNNINAIKEMLIYFDEYKRVLNGAIEYHEDYKNLFKDIISTFNEEEKKQFLANEEISEELKQKRAN